MRVQFEVEAETSFGEGISVVGSSKELGEWKADSALLMSTGPGKYPVWSTPFVSICPGNEFKFIKTNGLAVIWEPAENRCVPELVSSASKLKCGMFGSVSTIKVVREEDDMQKTSDGVPFDPCIQGKVIYSPVETIGGERGVLAEDNSIPRITTINETVQEEDMRSAFICDINVAGMAEAKCPATPCVDRFLEECSTALPDPTTTPLDNSIEHFDDARSTESPSFLTSILPESACSGISPTNSTALFNTPQLEPLLPSSNTPGNSPGRSCLSVINLAPRGQTTGCEEAVEGLITPSPGMLMDEVNTPAVVETMSSCRADALEDSVFYDVTSSTFHPPCPLSSGLNVDYKEGECSSRARQCEGFYQTILQEKFDRVPRVASSIGGTVVSDGHPSICRTLSGWYATCCGRIIDTPPETPRVLKRQ